MPTYTYCIRMQGVLDGNEQTSLPRDQLVDLDGEGAATTDHHWHLHQASKAVMS